MSLMYSSILSAEHDLQQAMRYWNAANHTLGILKTKDILSPVMEKAEALEKAEVRLKHDLMLMEWQKGHLSTALKGFQEILITLDKAKVPKGTRFSSIEEVLATYSVIRISEDAGLPPPNPQAVRLRLDGLRKHLKKTDWKNPRIHQALLLKTVIEFNIRDGVYHSGKLTEDPAFQKAVEIVDLYNKRALTCDHLPETDYLFWVHGSILDLVAHVAEKFPSPAHVIHCDQALRFFDELSSDYPKMVEYRSQKVLTMQRKATLEMTLGRREAARRTAREALKDSQGFLREFPDAYEAHFLAIQALIQNLKIDGDLPASPEKAAWALEAKNLTTQATNQWPEVIFAENKPDLFRWER